MFDENSKKPAHPLVGIALVIIFAALLGGIIGSVLSADLSATEAVSADKSVKAGFLRDVLNFIKGETPETSQVEMEREVELYRPVIDYEEAVVGAVLRAEPSVVSIIVTRDLPAVTRYPRDPFFLIPPEFREFFGDDFSIPTPVEEEKTERWEVGGGTGFVISSDGLIVTNRHVVAELDADYTVLTNDGRRFSAEVVARSPIQDLAVLRVNENNLKPLELGDSDALRLGQTVIAIGNALGEFRNTVSVGVVSGLSRMVIAQGPGGITERFEGMLQTDAAINRGNSGGPLLNLRGEVIGINAAVAVDAQNIGFAIPINDVKHAIESVKRTGEIEIPFIGVRYLLITQEVASRENLPVNYGALIRGTEEEPGVIPKTAAAEAGLRAEDIILEMNGRKINENQTLAQLIRRHNVGDTVTLKILRAGEEMEITLTLGKMPDL